MNQALSITTETLTNDLAITFAEIERVYQPRLSTAIRCLTGDAQASETLVHTILHTAYERLQQFSVEQLQSLDLAAWLCTIALNETNTWLTRHAERANPVESTPVS